MDKTDRATFSPPVFKFESKVIACRVLCEALGLRFVGSAEEGKNVLVGTREAGETYEKTLKKTRTAVSNRNAAL
jgi:hypothetical protein